MLVTEILITAALGFGAGVLGGLAGVGGSMLILPGLHAIFSREGEPAIHHLYMAAAMMTNIFVALPAARRHARSGTVRHDLIKPLIFSTIIFMLAGVALSNVLQGEWLKQLLALFIAGYCAVNIRRLLRKHAEPPAGHGSATNRTLWICGGTTGFVGGLLGLGGGVLLVPLLQVLARVGLRESIATSSSVIWISATFGAAGKVATIGQHGYTLPDVLLLVVLLAPGAIAGSLVGAYLTHKLPIRAVRLAITLVLLGAATKLLGLWGNTPAHAPLPPAIQSPAIQAPARVGSSASLATAGLVET